MCVLLSLTRLAKYEFSDLKTKKLIVLCLLQADTEQ